MTEAWQGLGRLLDTDRRELEALMPAELKRVLRELDAARRDLDEVALDLVREAFASPYGQPDAPNDLGVRVNADHSPPTNHVRVSNGETAKFVRGRLVGIVRELTRATLDARTECAHQRAGVEPPRGPYRRRSQRSC